MVLLPKFDYKRLNMDFKEIKELIKIFDRSELNKLKVKEGEFEVALQKGFDGASFVSSASTSLSAPIEQATPELSTTPIIEPAVQTTLNDTIDAPMVGTFYAAPSPEAPPFVKEGDIIKKGQALCILEAMKIMNEVEAEFDCKIVKVLVEDGSPVEYDMPIFVIEKL